jgi:hypothetical protein
LGGADRVRIEGQTGATIPVRIVAPPGTVEVIDQSSQPSAIRVYAPLPDDPPSPSTAAANDPETTKRIQHYETFRDWGSDALFFPQLGYDGTRGLVAGAILHRTGYDFQLDPESSVMNFAAAWSTGTNQPRLEYSLDLRTRAPVRGLLYLAYSGIDSVNYFGQGNETPRLQALESSNFYQVKQKVFVANPMIEVPLVGPLTARAGALLKHTSDVDGTGIIDATHPEGAGAMTLGSGELGVRMDTRAGTFPQQRGLSFDVIARHTPSIFSNPSAFTKLRGQVSGVAGGHALTDFQFSARVAGEKNWGDYPFFESAFLGGVAQSKGLDVTGASIGNLLRGYDLNRFAGDASVVGNAELDVVVGKFKAALPFRYGLTGLADVGRVFVAGESSSKWHTAYGGGFWLGIFASGVDFQFATALKATVVHSDEGTSIYVFTGFNL